jgi:galactokinase
MVKHELAENEYNVRRSECDEAVRLLRQASLPILSLRDLSMQQLQSNRDRLTDKLYRRCRHVLTENDRVIRMGEALTRRDTAAIRELMAESHRSLRDDFEVSCRELDLMVDLATQQSGTYGSRMTGGGFGGSTVNLVNTTDAAQIRKAIGSQYLSQTGISANIYICQAGGPVASVDVDRDREGSKAMY